MYVVLLLARITHVLAGVFWAGAMIFVSAFLFPAVRDAGPEGGKVVEGLARRRFMEIIPIVALLSIVSGSWLYWHDSAGTGSGFMRSAMGMAYGTGGALAIIAFIIGATMTRPAMTKATALSLEANRADPAKKEVMLAEAQSHRMRAGRAGKWVAILLGLAATAMAVGRYV